ncbi:unnamed protein product [Ophioblennius macclurei]
MEMDQLRDQNLTVHSGVNHWKSIPQTSATVENTIVILGVLTFVLQLCLALFFMRKCWKLENRVRQDEKSCVISKHQIYAAPSAAGFAVVRIDEDGSDFLCPPTIPWDLVQSA